MHGRCSATAAAKSSGRWTLGGRQSATGVMLSMQASAVSLYLADSMNSHLHAPQYRSSPPAGPTVSKPSSQKASVTNHAIAQLPSRCTVPLSRMLRSDAKLDPFCGAAHLQGLHWPGGRAAVGALEAQATRIPAHPRRDLKKHGERVSDQNVLTYTAKLMKHDAISYKAQSHTSIRTLV